MSRAERPVGLLIVEKLMGLVLLAMGIVAIYYVSQALEALGSYWLLFTAVGSFLIVVGLALVIARPE